VRGDWEIVLVLVLVLVLELSAWSCPKRFVLARRSKKESQLAPKFSSTSTSTKHEEDQRLLAPGFWLLAPFPSAVASRA
jgi:hypothetical protein